VLRYPLFDAGRSQGNVDLAEARKTIAVAEYEKALQQAFREIADLLAAREQYCRAVAGAGSCGQGAGRTPALVDARTKPGVSSYLELLDAQREYFAAQQSALAIRRQLLSTAASFYKALGGDDGKEARDL
jgi:multidrug efflux system outer membrane protein